MPPNALDVRQAYRNLYKAGLAAVQYSSPARYVLRNTLRVAFREEQHQQAPAAATAEDITTGDVSTTSTTSSSSPSPSPSSSSSPNYPSPPSVGVDPYQRYQPRYGFDAERIGNTVTFLRNAAKSRGLEHKMVKSLLHVRYWQRELYRDRWRTGRRYPVGYKDVLTRDGYRMFEDTLKALNESMVMCLR